MKNRLLCLLLAGLLLTGCAAPEESASSVESPLPEASAAPTDAVATAPIGDIGLSYEALTPLYLPSADGQQLLAVYETLSFSYSLHPAETILRALLAHEGGGHVQAASPVAVLPAGSDPVEVSGGVATVNLSAEAAQLSHQALHTLCRAIAATLCELPDVEYVNVLCGGVPLGMDEAGLLPLGSIAPQPEQELPVMWEQLQARRTPEGALPAETPLTAAATLYFPLADGSGIVPETRRIAFPGQHPQQLVISLLEALSAGPESAAGAAALPPLNHLMAAIPEITTLSDGSLRVTLRFTGDFPSWLASAGADPACSYAAIVCTLTTFVPGLSQVVLLTGERAVTSVACEAHGSKLFPGGLHRREDYSGYLMAMGEICHAEDGLLVPTATALPYRSIRWPRTLLRCLPALPEEGGVLPAPITDADMLGILVEGDTLILNLSARYAALLTADPEGQRLAAYAIVNTLCSSLGLRRVRFCFDSASVESLGGNVIWSGDFYYNPGLMSD